MNNREREIQKQNRKALPKYLITLLLCMLGGAVLGVGGALLRAESAGENLTAWLRNGLLCILPYGIPVVAVLFLVPAGLLLHQGKTLLRRWDGEDEDGADAIEDKLEYSIMLTNILMPVTMFFLSACIPLQSKMALWVVAEFLFSFGVSIRMQQKAVDLVRILNPEKQGSVYDQKFQSKWLDSCDENERRQIGEAAWCAFRATNIACMTLWVGLVVLNTVLDVGLLPSCMVLTIFLVNLLGYFYSCVQQTRRRKAKK